MLQQHELTGHPVNSTRGIEEGKEEIISSFGVGSPMNENNSFHLGLSLDCKKKHIFLQLVKLRSPIIGRTHLGFDIIDCRQDCLLKLTDQCIQSFQYFGLVCLSLYQVATSPRVGFHLNTKDFILPLAGFLQYIYKNTIREGELLKYVPSSLLEFVF